MHYKTTLITLLLAILLPLQAQEHTSDTLTLDSVGIEPLSPEDAQMPWDTRIKTELDRLAREADNAYFHTGICVWDLTADTFLWGYNNRKVMRPASTQKVLTAISALSILGAQHEFKTRAYYTGSITPDSILVGDIYVVGDFDPMYSISDLRTLARTIRDLGIRTIRGKIYADASMKSSDLYGNGWCWDDVPSKYEPYLCPLMVERGKTAPNFTSYSQDPSFHPATHFASILSQELRSLQVTGADAAPIDYGQKEYTHNGHNFYTKTRTIDQVMQRMLKNSDNLHAEAVFFQLAHFNTGRHCTWRDGARQVENVLRKAGTSTSYVEIADGSGVSLYNYVSPDAQVAMLRYAYKNDHIYRHFLPALPIAGVDGTLDTRMKTGNAHGNVRAKTGTLEGCIALAGYVTASNGHLLAFSILVNGVLSAQVARNYQDRVCQELAR
ncbi:MAG: D-alanyl-D-alanine carboxypeptidase/D-alanyl-D-alanine-endopeptidase [Bacteroidaceae bacterium]|nr:D-alanyl-D-alanine carboxypeptidase/D-alanyl-D-alanine-endopeptidase [Bacteroidaceae bacterium]